MTPTDMRNAIAAQCGFKHSKAQQDQDIGGNVIPDRVEANEDRYWEEEFERARLDLEYNPRVDDTEQGE